MQHHHPCPHHHHQPQQCGGSGQFATAYFSHFDGYIYVTNPRAEPERHGGSGHGRGRERSRRLPKRPPPPPNQHPFMQQQQHPMSVDFRPSVPYYVADTLPGGEHAAVAGHYRGSEEEEDCASSASGEQSTLELDQCHFMRSGMIDVRT